MMYWVIHYTDVLGGEDLGWDVICEEISEKIALFTKKEIAKKEANKLDTEFRYTRVIPLELTYVDKNYYIMVDK